jgi:hypothetical protein
VEKKLKKKLLIDYMYSNLKHHNFWAYRYFFCEFLALVNVGGESESGCPEASFFSILGAKLFTMGEVVP